MNAGAEDAANIPPKAGGGTEAGCGNLCEEDALPKPNWRDAAPGCAGPAAVLSCADDMMPAAMEGAAEAPLPKPNLKDEASADTELAESEGSGAEGTVPKPNCSGIVLAVPLKFR